jgi:hypothetical protein
MLLGVATFLASGRGFVLMFMATDQRRDQAPNQGMGRPQSDKSNDGAFQRWVKAPWPLFGRSNSGRSIELDSTESQDRRVNQNDKNLKKSAVTTRPLRA